MAKTKKAKKAASASFIVLHSSCGGVQQLTSPYGVERGYPTLAAAKETVSDVIEDIRSEGDEIGTIVIAQIVEVGKPSGVEWTGKTSL